MLTARQLASILHEALREAPEQKKREIIRKFVFLLRQRRLLGLGPRILRAFAEEQRKGGIFGETAHAVRLPGVHAVTQETVIAGARLRKGERVADTTISGRLSQLKRTLGVSK